MIFWIKEIFGWVLIITTCALFYYVYNLPESFGPSAPTFLEKCEQRGGTYLRHEGKCVQLKEIKIEELL